MADINVFEFEEQQKYLKEHTAGFAKLGEAFVSGTTEATGEMCVGTIILDSSYKPYLVTAVADDGQMTGISLGASS